MEYIGHGKTERYILNFNNLSKSTNYHYKSKYFNLYYRN